MNTRLKRRFIWTALLLVTGTAGARDPDWPPYCGDHPGDSVSNHLWKQEVGDAVYRELGNVVGWYDSPRWPGHAALYIGYHDGTEKVIHAAGDGSLELGRVQTDSFSGIHSYEGGALEYWGAYRNPAVQTYADRRAILAQAWALHSDPDIGYTFLDCVDYNGLSWSGGIPDIDDVRCDGVTEFAFEKAGFHAWGRYGENFDITASTAWCDQHNIEPIGLPPIFDMFNPNINAYPCSQAGRPGPGIVNISSILRPTTAASPTIVANIVFCHAGDPVHNWYRGDVDVRITARDVSGIHRISTKQDGERETGSSGWTDYLFTAGNEQESISVTVDRSAPLYYFAEDKAANYPRYAAVLAVQIDPYRPTLTIQSPAASTFQTSAARISISGTAADTGGSGLYRVEAYKDQYIQYFVFDGFPAQGNFTIADFPLAIGINTIHLRSIDYAGWPSAEATIQILCQPATLTVLSAPDNGVTINLAPSDLDGLFGGNTGFARRYQGGEYVTLGAPASFGGRDFLRWERNGTLWATSLLTAITIESNCTMTAVYLDEAYAPPAIPSGTVAGFTGESYPYTSAGAAHPLHTADGLQYEYDWGAGASGMWGEGTQSHSWGSPFSGQIRVRSRCALHTTVVSPWSVPLSVWIQNEAVTLPFPATPDGPTDCILGQPHTYIGLAASNAGHSLQYQFDWGDGSPLPAWGPAAQQHVWNAPPTVYYPVRFRARCAAHTNVLSSWSNQLAVDSVLPEAITTPPAPDGPRSILVGQSHLYSVGGVASTLGHPLEYEYDWGDGGTGFRDAAEQPYFWKEPGNHDVRVRARCAAHTSRVSAWSPPTTVCVDHVAITDPDRPGGETNCVSGNAYGYLTQTIITPADTLLIYKTGYEYDWGDGPSGSWDAPDQSHTWTTGTPTVKSIRVRAQLIVEGRKDPILSGWSPPLTISLDRERISRPFRISGETNCVIGRTYAYTFAAESNAGHPLEYLFRWPGIAGTWGAGSRNRVFTETGLFYLYVRARCAIHSGLESADSLPLGVNVVRPPIWLTVDFDGDGYSDIGYYRPDDGLWMLKYSAGGTRQNTFGYPGTIPITGDFDGDGVCDYGCYDPVGVPGHAPPGSWYIMQSTKGFRTATFGYPGTIPITGDFDGDGKCDYGCYDPAGIPGHVSPGSWYLMQSTKGFRTATFGYRGTVPVTGDFDGDGKCDYGCYDAVGIPSHAPPGSWYLMQSTKGFRTATFGYRGTVPVTGDFDGDGKSDFGCYDAVGIPGHAPPGSWYLMQSTKGFRTATFGYRDTVPVVADYDGDGKSDFGCYDANGIPGQVAPGTWYLMQSGGRFRKVVWGSAGTIPLGK